MDFSANRYSSAWRHDNADKKYVIEGSRLGPGWDGFEADVGSSYESASRAKEAIRITMEQIRADIQKMKRGDFSPVGVWSRLDEREQEDFIAEFEDMLRKARAWKVVAK